MFMGLKSAPQVGDKVTVELRFEKAGLRQGRAGREGPDVQRTGSDVHDRPRPLTDRGTDTP